ncbi:hypothetical protein CSB08_00295 [Candidatus Gracilibacteria bacterium]|nr:MAG: hypothetical protein CSB08_00295 [Candidatus Gracilibacteria bacterium]PIE85282.1 MAG: hypothetical protein CSA08_02645 [Candidatus Gracilibacteria bacterium]
MENDLSNKLKNFTPISLTQMNSTASFLDRIEKKYLISKKQLELVLKELEKDFYVLEINDKSVFTYDNVYMDTKNHDFYKLHQEGKKSRTKIRTRLYVDSNISFFEYKQKQDKTIRKFRYEFPSEEHGTMTKGKTRFYEGVYMSFYGKLPEKITPSLNTNYNRLTLCAKDNGERVTVDFNIKTKNLRDPKAKKTSLENAVILESKSMSEDCLSHRVMKKLGIETASSCSKYCLGLIYSGIEGGKGKFKKTIKQIKEMK